MDALSLVSCECIIHTSQVRAICLNPDGSEDYKIYVAKSDGPCPGGKAIFHTKKAGGFAASAPVEVADDNDSEVV